MIKLPAHFLAAASIAAIVALTGCGQKEEKTAAASVSATNAPLLIGIIESVTGPAASYGDAHNKGTQLAIDEINKAGGFNGVPLEVYREDDKSDPATGISAAKKLITQRKVGAIVGSSTSLVTIAFAKENEKYSVPLVNGMAGSPTITEQGFKYTWRIKVTDNQLDSKVIERYIQEKSVGKIAFLVENSDFGKPPTQMAADRARKLGAEIVAYEEYNRGETDFRAQLTKIRDQDPDLLFLHSYYTEGSLITRQARELGLKALLVTNEGQSVPKFPELAGAAAEGVVFVTGWLPGLDDERSKRFESLYQDRYKIKPGAFAAGSYEAVYVVLEAARRGGGTSPEQIQTGLGQLKGFETVLGPIQFDDKNQNDGAVRLAQVKDGKIVPLN